MRRIAAVAVLGMWFAAAGWAQQTDGNTYELRGKVVNAVTGGGVGNALVRLGASPQQVQFSGPDGSFTFTDVPRGDYFLQASKPGFFSQQDLGHGGVDSFSLPGETDQTIKLVPEGVIYGRVENETGQPLEGLMVRAETWQVINGVKQLQPAAAALTDDEGQFRIAELRPGGYYVHFVPSSNGRGYRVFSELARKKQDEQGYGSQFYPGVADVTTATVVRIRPGTQARVVQSLNRQKLYEVSGVVRGANLEHGFHVTLMDSVGAPVEKNLHLDGKTGGFQIEGVPEGTYMLTAFVQEEEGGGGAGGDRPPLAASLPIHLNQDTSGLMLLVSRGATIGVKIEDEIPAEGQAAEQVLHQVSINLTSTDFRQMSQGLILPQPNGVPTGQADRFPGVAAGTYEVQAWAVGQGYVASLRCGDVDLLREDLTVAPGATVPSIEVTLRGDGAQIDVETTENGKVAAAAVVLYSEEYPKTSTVVRGNGGSIPFSNVRPGAYRIVALKGLGEVDYRDVAFAEKYLAQGKEVELRAGDKLKVEVEAVEREEE